jgi:lipopolysaccharide transport system ATP-binding protein
MNVIEVNNLSRLYNLGEVGTGPLYKDLNPWWASLRGKNDPSAETGQVNDRTKKGKNEAVWAIQDINFSVSQGEGVGIIGRNRAGKRTLLKIISRITIPSRATVKAKGRIAYLLEVRTGFYSEGTGREKIFMNERLLGMICREIQSKLPRLLTLLELRCTSRLLNAIN